MAVLLRGVTVIIFTVYIYIDSQLTGPAESDHFDEKDKGTHVRRHSALTGKGGSQASSVYSPGVRRHTVGTDQGRLARDPPCSSHASDTLESADFHPMVNVKDD